MHRTDHFPRLLIVEDSPSDARLLKDALRDYTQPELVHVVNDGQMALDFLHHESNRNRLARPDLIIMDLNMPKRSGQDVLEEIKTDPALRSIPVIMFTSSENESDVRRAYDAHANCFITKPMEAAGWLRVVEAIESFWLKTVTLPE
jgi:chemotaxis family two-component system response regulator Rcp1